MLAQANNSYRASNINSSYKLILKYFTDGHSGEHNCKCFHSFAFTDPTQNILITPHDCINYKHVYNKFWDIIFMSNFRVPISNKEGSNIGGWPNGDKSFILNNNQLNFISHYSNLNIWYEFSGRVAIDSLTLCLITKAMGYEVGHYIITANQWSAPDDIELKREFIKPYCFSFKHHICNIDLINAWPKGMMLNDGVLKDVWFLYNQFISQGMSTRQHIIFLEKIREQLYYNKKFFDSCELFKEHIAYLCLQKLKDCQLDNVSVYSEYVTYFNNILKDVSSMFRWELK